MIDWITAKIPCLHVPLKTGAVMRIGPDGEVEWSTVCRTSVRGSYDNAIQVRSLGSDGNGHAEILHIDGNPSKFLQGHNIVGSDDLIGLITATLPRLVYSLCDAGLATPFLENSIDWPAVRNGEFEVDRLDINYMFELPSRSDVNAWLRSAEYSSHTRHGRPRNDKGTVYWGKQSRRWSLKAYSKAAEIEGRGAHRLPDDPRFKPLQDWVQNKLRLEVVLRQMELRQLGITQAKDIQAERVREVYGQYLGRLEMAEKVLLNDQQALELPRAARATYLMWKQGMVPFDVLPRPTFYRHRKKLLEHGIDISNPPPVASGGNVVPLLRVLEAKPVEVPQWAYDQRLIAVA